MTTENKSPFARAWEDYRAKNPETFDARTIQDLIKAGLHESLTHVVDSTHAIGDAVYHAFFAAEFQPPPPSHTGMTQTMGAMTQSQS